MEKWFIWADEYVFHLFILYSLLYVNWGKGITIFLSGVTLFTTFMFMNPEVNKKVFVWLLPQDAFQNLQLLDKYFTSLYGSAVFLILKVKVLIWCPGDMKIYFQLCLCCDQSSCLICPLDYTLLTLYDMVLFRVAGKLLKKC